MGVRLFLRRPMAGNRSVERLFKALEPHLGAETMVLPCESRGWRNRVKNLRWAWARAAEVNHVGGDVQYLMLALPRRGSVLTVLDLVSLRRLTGVKRAVFRAIWYAGPLRRAAVVTTISEAIRAELEAEFPEARGKTRTVPVPLVGGFAAYPRPFRAKPRILLQGSATTKNVARQARALAGLKTDAIYVGAPDAETRQALETIGAEIKTDLTDAQMLAEYRECDLVLFASLYEGYGMPIVEAQAIGRPVITSDRGAMMEVAGGAALLVDPESEESIRAGVQRVIEEPELRARLIEAGYVNAAKATVERVAEMYRQAYRDATSESYEEKSGV